ncbi:hypothetical protein CYMTET_42364 [Cymbomonas tetramitiformis]|uniref:Uncharacterized protein n=1 Tax=Cymbomonas tetramitiformis TaxID=36881 RepID=A0AAE0C5K9_9CHLO|nr:hypothetical protein CYMTET_42364 [Cymbomonas tetramitiformis]
MKTAAFQALTEEQKQAVKDSKPDFRSIWDLIPSMLAGDDQATSPAYEWRCAAYEKDGMMASTAFRVLKDISVRDSFQGSVRCALPLFHEMKVGETRIVCRPVEADDADGEQGGHEWLTEGTSTRGLTGVDGTEDTHYFWALRAFVAELEAKFLMKGTKEKEDLLVAKPQTPEQDGLAYVKLCMRREAALDADKMVADSTTRQNIEDCIKLLRIREYKNRVSEQLRMQFPAPTKVTWKDLEVIVEVQDKLKNDAESWALTLQQELTRKSNCVYSCYEARQLGIDLPEVVAAIRRSGAAKKVEAGDRRKDFKKKEPAARAGEEAPKKPAREAHNAERAKHSYNKVPPPDAKKDKQCKYCFIQIPHSLDRCYTGSWDAYVPQDFHKKRHNRHMNTRLTAELSSMQAAGQAGGGDGARAQALSEDELEYESHFNEREEYAAEDRLGSAGEEEVVNDHLEDGSMPELQARVAVALGNTQKMQGFPVKTSEEFDKDAQVPRAVPADFLSRKMHLMASHIRSSKQTCTQIAATLVARGLIRL